MRAEFSSMDNFHCQIPHTVHLENNTDSLDAAAVSYQWRIYEEGSLVHYSTLEEPDFTFTKMPGQYDVELFAYGSNGCVDSVYKKKFIYQDSMRLIFDVNPKIVCLEQTVFTKNQTRPTTYVASDQFKWYFYDLNDTTILDSSDLRAPTFSYDEVGKYDMQVIGFNALGCSDTLRLEDIVEVVQPQLDYEIPNPIVCLGESIYLEGKTTPDRANFTHDWSLEKNNSNLEYTKKGKNSSVTPKEMGEYNAIYTHSIKGGCVAKDTTPVFVNGIVAEIELDTVFGCAPLVVSPQAIVTQDFYEGATEQSYEYNWTVTPNKGVIILGQDQARPTITFSEDRDYTVSLKITNAVGCIFKTKSEIVRVGVRAGFSIDDPIICFGDSLKVEDRSYNGVSNMTWSISPDFASQGLEYASRKYSFGISVPGDYTIKQVVTNGGECWDSLTRTFKDLQVIADFNAADSFLRCAPVYAEFLSTSTGADTCIWDFGLNESFKTISSSAGVIYQKNSGWTDGYDIQLIAKNKEGCTDTFLREDYIVVAGPVAKFEIENFVGCDPLKVQFKNESEDAKYSYFNYNDGSAVDSAESASGLKYHSYSVVAPTVLSQKILPSIIVYDSLGCGATYEPEDTVLVYRSPKAKMVYPNGNELCESESISFKDNGTFTNSRRWFLEGEEISTKKQDNTDALQLGDNELVLISKNSNNCSDTIADNVVVNAKPKIKLAVDDTLCLEQQLMFLATVDLDSLVDKIDWDFGEISRSRGMPRFTPSFIYRSPGDKNVKLKVSLTNGCSDSISKQIYVTNENNIDNPPIHFITFVSETEVLISFKQSDYHRFKNYILNDGNQEKKYFDRTQTELSLKLDNKPLVPSFYHVRVGDLCEFEGVPSDEHAFMILSVESSEPYTNKLSWTPYVGWDKVEKYIIHRQNDEGEYVNIGEVAGDVSSYIDVELCNRPYTYKIEAVNSNPAYYSFSYAVESAPIYIENPLATSIKNVSVVADKTIEVKWNASSFSEFDKFKVLKYENDFSRMVEEFYTEDTSFFDTDVYTSENSYIYQVLEIDRCGLLSDTGREGKSILLTGIYDERSILDWTAYEEWLGGVQTYALEIEKPSGFVPVYQNNGNITEYMDEEVYTDVSSKYCYRTYGVSTDSDTSYSNIVCLYGDLDVWIPTAFSPNSDGLNEGFNPVTRFLRAYDINELENYELTIYNRWGEKVFDSNNPAESWDGTYLGEDCQVGVYMYKVKITGIDKTRTYKNGTITLLR